MIPFNKPYYSGKELEYIAESFSNGKISGDGMFTKRCHDFFEKKYDFNKVLLTTSCTDALEMASILIDTKPGDEIIAPSYTFVSTVNAFVLRGANIIFVDSYEHNPNIDADKIEELLTPKTKAIIVVHYAGVACNMDKIMQLAEEYNLFVIEDAAQAIDSYYKGLDGNRKPLGSIGHLAAFSFHETKNIISGEGGMLVINDERFVERAEIIREKGTNRSKFFRGEVDKYGWVDIGSSFLPSDIIAAVLFAQLEQIENIQNRRLAIWNQYYNLLFPLFQKGFIGMPSIPLYASNNAHMFYILFSSIEKRSKVIASLRQEGIMSVFHYLSLHKSTYFKEKYNGSNLDNADHYTDCLLRLPFFYELSDENILKIAETLFKSCG